MFQCVTEIDSGFGGCKHSVSDAVYERSVHPKNPLLSDPVKDYKVEIKR